MNDLVTLMRNEATTTSLLIADVFGKRHDRVLRAIENVISNVPKNEDVAPMFWKTTYQDVKGERRPMYKMNRDGFSLVVMGFTGEKAMTWKLKFLDRFNAMEKIIRERLTIEWRETRTNGKLTRKAETDIIQKLIEYAKEQGSQNSNKLYIVYSRLANKAAGVKCRDVASIKELNRLEEAEEMILKIIRRDMALGLHYKRIYQNCKERLDAWQEILMVA